MQGSSGPFNSALETGIRALVILEAVFPGALDLNRLVDFDYLTVHSGDAGGPPSLHAPLPLRPGELLVRRGIIERGLLLMMSRGLVHRAATAKGIEYLASEIAGPFLSALTADYIIELRERAAWVVEQFGSATDKELSTLTRRFFSEWTTQFQSMEGHQ